MKNSLAIMFIFVLASMSAFGRINVTENHIFFDEDVTVENAEHALAEYVAKGWERGGLELVLNGCTDEGLAVAARTFGGFRALCLKGSPKLTSLEALRGAENCRMVVLEALPNVKDVSVLGSMPLLESMKLTRVGFANGDLGFCAALHELTELSLSWTPPTFASVHGIEGCGKLRQFALAHNGGKVDLGGLSSCPSLQSVELLSTTGLELAPLTAVPNLETLNLYGSRKLSLAPLAGCKCLKSLNIYAVKEIQDFTILGEIQSLEELETGLTGMAELDWAPRLPKLKHLSMVGEACDHYAPLAQCRHLERLKLMDMRNPLDINELAEGLAQAPLKELSIERTLMANEDGLAALAKCPLEVLNLNHANTKGRLVLPLNLEFLKSLASNLKELHINKINAKNFEAVSECRQLKELSVACQSDVDLAMIASLPQLERVTVRRGRKAELEALLGDRKLQVIEY